MERWTIKALNETDDLSFAIRILNERAINLNYNAPLYGKIVKAVATLKRFRQLCADTKTEGNENIEN